MAKVKKGLANSREFVQYNEWIARMYPELHTTEIKGINIIRKLTRSFTFQVTDACNLACTYCYQINKGIRRMPFETAKLAVDKLLSGEDNFGEYLNEDISPGITLEFIGGEPFLEIDLIDQIVDYFRQRAIELRHPWANRFMVSICSNGVLYKDEKVQRFLQKNRNNISFSVTVDGVKELHDSCRIFPDGRPSYDIAHGAAMDWMSRGYYMGSKITIAPANITYLADSLKKMIDDGYDDINANFVYEDGWKKEHATEVYKQIKRFTDETLMDFDKNDYTISLLSNNGYPMSHSENSNWCGGTGSMFAVDPDGRLFPCIRYMESSLGTEIQPYLIGDVWNGFTKRPEEIQRMNCMNCVTRRSQSSDECWYCPVSKGCGWCSGYNYQTFGTVDKRTTFHCIMHKARSLATVYYHNKHVASGDAGEPKSLMLPEYMAVDIIGQELYDELVKLTTDLGGYVNKSNKSGALNCSKAGSILKEEYANKFIKFFDIDNSAELAEVKSIESKLDKEKLTDIITKKDEVISKLQESRNQINRLN